MSFRLFTQIREFFASRFSLEDNSLWRLMQLLKPMRRRIIVANIVLTLASAFSGAAIVALYPLFNATLAAHKAEAPQKTKAVPARLAAPANRVAGPAGSIALTSATLTDAGSTSETKSKTSKAVSSAMKKLKKKKASLSDHIFDSADRWSWFHALHQGLQHKIDRISAWMSVTPQRFIVVNILFILMLYVVGGGFQFVGDYLMSTVAAILATNLMRGLYSNALRQEMAFFDRNSTGSLLNLCHRQAFQLQTMIPMLASRRVMLPVTMLIYFGFLLIISWKLSLLLLALLPIVVIPTMLLTRHLKRTLRGELNHETGAIDVMSQGFQGIQAIKAFGAERLETAQLEPSINWYFQITRVRRITQAFVGPLVDLLNIIILLTVLILALFIFPRLLHGEQGRLFAFLFAIRQFYKPFSSLMTMNVQMQRVQMVAQKIFWLLDRNPEIQDAPDAADFPAGWRTLRFEDVGLIYTMEQKKSKKTLEKVALKHVNLRIQRGELVALAGPNGAGKSSMVKVICRLYDPTSGAVFFDDVPLARIRMASLREQICLITQHPVLFNRPISENIAFGLEGVDQARIEAAAKAVRAHDFIMRLPQGYETPAGETGKLLSGGERQKIVLARAFVRNPSLLIFDEPTAGLDQESADEMVELINELRRRGITIIWITHDRSHLIHADRILELTPKRRIVEISKEEALAPQPPKE